MVRDRWWMKAFVSHPSGITRHELEFRLNKVIYLLFCETSHTVFTMGVIYEPLILRYGIDFSSSLWGQCLMANSTATPEVYTTAPTCKNQPPLDLTTAHSEIQCCRLVSSLECRLTEFIDWTYKVPPSTVSFNRLNSLPFS